MNEAKAPAKTCLKGHKGTVLCLDTAVASPLVVSGAEDGTARVWDLRTCKAVRMLMMPAHSDGKTEHLSATTAASDTAVNSVTFADREDQLVAVSAGQRIGWFDLRQSSVLLKAPAHTVQYNQDEINQLVFDRANGRLASCDDAGEVQVIQMPSRERIRTLKGKHTSICSNVQFRPRHPGHVLTGGLDCMLHWWDISRSVPLCIASCSSAPIAASGSNAAQVCNPPFVHSLHAHSSGDLLAAALGDGAVALYSLARNSGSAGAGRARSRGRAPASSLLARGGGFSLEPLVRLEGHGASAVSYTHLTLPTNREV